jgi:hypothetical protein
MVNSYTLTEFFLPTAPRVSPHLSRLQQYSSRWAKSVGMLDEGVWDERRFEAARYPLFAACTFPDASMDMLSLAADWYLWGFYFDDWFLERYKNVGDSGGAATYVARLRQFIDDGEINRFAARRIEPVDAVQRGLMQLWERTRPLLSRSLRSRFAASTFGQVEDALWELANIGRRRVPNLPEYLRQRRGSGGGRWIADMVEVICHAELPPKLVGTQVHQTLRDSFGDAAFLRNDLFSYDREVQLENETSNSVLVLQQWLQADPQRAAEGVNQMITARMVAFEHAARIALPAACAELGLGQKERAAAQGWIDGLRTWQAGLHEWQLQSPRYSGGVARERATASASAAIPRQIPDLIEFIDARQRDSGYLLMAKQLGATLDVDMAELSNASPSVQRLLEALADVLTWRRDIETWHGQVAADIDKTNNAVEIVRQVFAADARMAADIAARLADARLEEFEILAEDCLTEIAGRHVTSLYSGAVRYVAGLRRLVQGYPQGRLDRSAAVQPAGAS